LLAHFQSPWFLCFNVCSLQDLLYRE
jgi:hypothetical protein